MNTGDLVVSLFPEPCRRNATRGRGGIGSCPLRCVRGRSCWPSVADLDREALEAGHPGDLGKPHACKWQDLPSEVLRVVDGFGIGLVPTPTAPDVGDDGTRLAWPLHEPTKLPVDEARQGTEQRPCNPRRSTGTRHRIGRATYQRPQLSGKARSMASRRSASERCRYLVVVAMLECSNSVDVPRRLVDSLQVVQEVGDAGRDLRQDQQRQGR